MVFRESTVTPCVGVWIETYRHILQPLPLEVTPCVGVWIETVISSPCQQCT